MRDFDWQIIITLRSTLSITKTAELLFMSQPALTKRIRTIESELGIPLLIRSHQGSVFTPEGEQIAKKAEKVVAAIKEAKNEADLRSSGVKGSIRIGVPYSFMRYVLPTILAQYTALYPDVDVDIITMQSHELIPYVEDGTLDLCFARYSAENSPLERKLYSRDQAAVIYNRPFDLNELPGLPYIEFAMNPGSRSAVQRWWNERFDREQRRRFTVRTADACISMVQHGLGYCILLDSRDFKNVDGIFSIPLEYLDNSKLIRNTWIFYKKESLASPAFSGFLKTACEVQL